MRLTLALLSADVTAWISDELSIGAIVLMALGIVGWTVKLARRRVRWWLNVGFEVNVQHPRLTEGNSTGVDVDRGKCHRCPRSRRP